MKVDFHLHSTSSDGTCTPEEVAFLTRDFAAVALTDHDNSDGVEAFLSAANSSRRYAGVELSIDPGEGFDKFHLLALGVNVNAQSFTSLLSRIRQEREARNEKIKSNFHRIGIPIEPKQDGRILARPHFARWLIANGYVASIPEAFEKYLLPDSPAETRCYEYRWRPPQEDVFEAVHAAGGIAIMAHPKFWNNAWKLGSCDFTLAERGLAELKEKGLDGVEAIYSANSPEENVEFTRIALKHGLLTSAGSDFHGANKKDILPGMEVGEGFISPLLERLSCNLVA